MEKAELEHSSASNIDFQFASIYYRMSQNGYNFKYSSLSSLHFHDASLGTAKCKTCNYNVIHKSQFGSNFDCVQIKTWIDVSNLSLTSNYVLTTFFLSFW